MKKARALRGIPMSSAKSVDVQVNSQEMTAAIFRDIDGTRSYTTKKSSQPTRKQNTTITNDQIKFIVDKLNLGSSHVLTLNRKAEQSLLKAAKLAKPKIKVNSSNNPKTFPSPVLPASAHTISGLLPDVTQKLFLECEPNCKTCEKFLIELSQHIQKAHLPLQNRKNKLDSKYTGISGNVNLFQAAVCKDHTSDNNKELQLGFQNRKRVNYEYVNSNAKETQDSNVDIGSELLSEISKRSKADVEIQFCARAPHISVEPEITTTISLTHFVKQEIQKEEDNNDNDYQVYEYNGLEFLEQSLKTETDGEADDNDSDIMETEVSQMAHANKNYVNNFAEDGNTETEEIDIESDKDTSTSEDDYDPEDPDYKPNQKIKHTRIRTSASGSHECNICQKNFEMKSRLKRHMKIHSEKGETSHIYIQQV